MIVWMTGALEAPDDQAFIETLYKDFRKLMFYTARKYTHSLPDQKDIVQDSMENLMKKVSTLRPMDRCALASYIVYTIRSTSIDLLRVQKRSAERTVSLEDPEFLEREAAEPALDDFVISAERLAQIKKVWPDLPEEDRALLDGKYIWGYTDEELAAKLKCKPDSIRMKLTRARRRAFERLAEKEEV